MRWLASDAGAASGPPSSLRFTRPRSVERQLGLLDVASGVAHDFRAGAAGAGDPEVLIGEPRRLAAARRAADEALLHEERLVDVLERARVLAQDDRQRLQADRATVVALDERFEHPTVHLVQS